LNNFATINTADVTGGYVYNHGSITTINVNSSGGIYNFADGRIDYLDLEGGYWNDGTIIEMRYWNYYKLDPPPSTNQAGPFMAISATGGSLQPLAANRSISTGIVETLIIAGNLDWTHTASWGTIENIRFDENGEGILTIPVYISDDSTIFFDSISAMSIDLTWGNIAFDLTSFVDIPEEELLAALFTEFSLGSLFDITEVTGGEELSSLQITRGDEYFIILDEGKPVEGWSFDFTTGSLSWDGDTPIVWSRHDSPSSTPEPATLLVLGLGAIGAGFVARRRK